MFSFTKLLVFLSIFFVVAIAAPHQELPPRPGYVPVYIREGNTPLSQIHPKLVEAFKEDGESNYIQGEPATAKEAKIANSDKSKPVAENLKKEDKEGVNGQNKPINDDVDNTEEQEKTHKEVKQPIEETPASDIAEFTSDDLKILIDDKTDK